MQYHNLFKFLKLWSSWLQTRSSVVSVCHPLHWSYQPLDVSSKKKSNWIYIEGCALYYLDSGPFLLPLLTQCLLWTVMFSSLLRSVNTLPDSHYWRLGDISIPVCFLSEVPRYLTSELITKLLPNNQLWTGYVSDLKLYYFILLYWCCSYSVVLSYFFLWFCVCVQWCVVWSALQKRCRAQCELLSS